MYSKFSRISSSLASYGKKWIKIRPIAYMPIYSRITGSVTAGILLSQIVYWDGRMQHHQFYKTDKDFCEELSMGATELKNAKKTLTRMELIIVVRKGIPAKTHYQLNMGKLSDLITTSVKKSKPVKGKPSNKKDGKNPTITYTTADTTSENNDNDFSYQKKLKKHAYTIQIHLRSNPSSNEIVNEAIQYYIDTYGAVTGKPHPKITEQQFEYVKDGFIPENSLLEDLGFGEYKEIIDSWFGDENVESDYNIIHFASGEVIMQHAFKTIR